MEYLLLENGKLVANGESKDILSYFGINTKKQRNNQQNKMYWKLINQLAIKLKTSVEEIHFNMLRDYSVRYEILETDTHESYDEKEDEAERDDE